jgi:hypothetical protein
MQCACMHACNRCLRSNKGVVGLNNCTLVVETSNMDYISHWWVVRVTLLVGMHAHTMQRGTDPGLGGQQSGIKAAWQLAQRVQGQESADWQSFRLEAR